MLRESWVETPEYLHRLQGVPVSEKRHVPPDPPLLSSSRETGGRKKERCREEINPDGDVEARRLVQIAFGWNGNTVSQHQHGQADQPQDDPGETHGGECAGFHQSPPTPANDFRER